MLAFFIHGKIYLHLENHGKLLRGFQIEFRHQGFIIRILGILRTWALFTFKWLIILAMSLLEKFIESRYLFVTQAVLISKKMVKNSGFSLKSVWNLFS